MNTEIEVPKRTTSSLQTSHLKNPLKIPRLPLALVLLFSAALAADAQVESGKIVGTVRDASGANISVATITVTQIQTNAVKKMVTNSEGEYVATELKPGTYTVKAECAGFKTAVESAFKLDI